MEHQLRYKLKKVKKRWVTAAVAVGTVLTGLSPVLAEQQAAAPEAEAVATAQENAAAEQERAGTVEADGQAAPDEAETDQEVRPDDRLEQAQPTEEQQATEQPANEDRQTVELKPEAQNNAEAAQADQHQPQSQEQFLTKAQTAAERSLTNIPNVQQINGQYFYIENGQIKKNFSLQYGRQTLYFDDQTGALTDTSKYQFTLGLTSLVNDYTEHNQIISAEEQNAETIDSYLTADSWYRPKDILQNGRTWTPSTEQDLRPLLMVWWPDKQTQINYLNFMNQQGLGTGIVYNADSAQAALNLAAQEVQRKIETKIAQERGTGWLRDALAKFVKSQPDWNKSSESETTGLLGKDHLQGGALLYVNNDKTEHANSDYRLLNRTPTNQTGKPKYFSDKSVPLGGYEFLLANDIDNSNPAVQAEQLNWLHYIMNFGSLVANDPEANFDGVRIDAVDNVNADLLQIASDYLKARYRVNDSEANAINHLSILEAWNDNDPAYNLNKTDGTDGAALPIDNTLRYSLLYSLARPINFTEDNGTPNHRSGLSPLITNSLNDRSADKKNDKRMANYVFVRAHDSEVQTVIGKIIREQTGTDTDGMTNVSMDDIKKAFAEYNADIYRAEKKYTQHNIPASYALMLSNKDSITRVYYGDMYTDDGHYMAKKTPYYDAIETLMKARIKYAAGGQDMAITEITGANKKDWAWDYSGVLTSVRYGTGANEAADTGTQATRTQGMAVIVANNPDLKLAQSDQVRVNMGAAHKNQAYRPLLLTDKDGLHHYLSDNDVPKHLIRRTDENGYLTFNAKDIAGYSNIQVSGYLAAWVPVGAPDDQDVRVPANQKANASGLTYESSAALDSQLIYEGFSNFQEIVSKGSESLYTNKVIAQNAELFKSWGVTSFEMPPQYVSSEDGSFLDSIILNGYAFEDRYDMALSKNNKYGSKQDLINALKALHKQGIQVIADWVPDQIYNLPGKEVVTASRVDKEGKVVPESLIKELLYVANTKSSGQDYQSKYGGAYLDELKAKYPDIFKRVQISTGKPIDADTKIKSWKAEYFNGTNILGRGARYVLSDKATQNYFTLSDDEDDAFLPRQLTNNKAQTGFVSKGRGRGRTINFYSTSGYQARNAFIQDAKGNWYYFDEKGNMVFGQRTINGKDYYFLPNGVQLRNGTLKQADGSLLFFNELGERY